jgi:hypothetical protein
MICGFVEAILSGRPFIHEYMLDISTDRSDPNLGP